MKSIMYKKRNNMNNGIEKTALEKYIKAYDDFEKIKTNNAQHVIEIFSEDWINIRDKDDGLSTYGIALIILSDAYSKSKINEEQTNKLNAIIKEFCMGNKFPNQDGIKKILYYNLGICWQKIDNENKAIKAFKKYIYYQIKQSKNYNLPSTAYAFRKCNTHLYQSLINNHLNLSSPTTFNDPFDCPILELLNNEEGIPALIRTAYKDCLKIACFIQPQQDLDKAKGEKDVLNNRLMWSHYADSHKGICIKYNLKNYDINSINKNNTVAYFKNVEYPSSKKIKKKIKDKINFYDAFFIKGKEWKYENELRLLYFNTNGKEEHKSIPISKCIEAIYFGLKCSSKDILAIKNLIADKNIKIYKMKADKKNFGHLEAEEILTKKKSKQTKSTSKV